MCSSAELRCKGDLRNGEGRPKKKTRKREASLSGIKFFNEGMRLRAAGDSIPSPKARNPA